MNYKEMVLLEDLVESISPEHHYKISFILRDKTLCIGDFRKRKMDKSLSTDDHSVIHSEKLLNDLMSFLSDEDEQSRQFTIDLFDHLQGDVIFKMKKLENHLLASLVVFLTDEEFNPNDYLIGYDGLEVIYNFSTAKGNHGEFVLDGREVEPFALNDLTERENL
ncbi:hypothetical protein AAK882_05275 [Carnobacteriaceae bacterium 52-44]